MSAPSLEGSESHGLHVGYSLQYADHEKGPSVPALSSTALPRLLDVIDHLWLGISTPSDEDQPSEEQPDLLESLAAKGVPKSSKTKDAYQKFVNILDARPHIRDLAPIQRPKGDPPVPPRRADPPPKSVVGNPATNSGASVGSGWVPGRIPTDEGDPQRSSIHMDPLHTKPTVFLSKVSVPAPPFPPQGPNSGEGKWANGDPSGIGVVPAAPVDNFQRDPSSDKMSRQESSTPGAVGPTRGILHPSKLPRKDLKYSEKQHTPLGPLGCTVEHVHLTDITTSERGSTSGSETAKQKEPDTPDLGSEGASAPVQNWVKHPRRGFST